MAINEVKTAQSDIESIRNEEIQNEKKVKALIIVNRYDCSVPK